jgi:glutathione S-transferase
LLDKQAILRGGDEIVDYLETDYPDPKIRGHNEKEMLAIQRYIEVYHELGRGLRADAMLRFRRNIDVFSREGSFGFLPKFGRVPVANRILERLEEIWECDTTNFQQNREQILASLRSIAPQLRPGQPLVGDTITDADVCFCELGNLFRPEQEGRNEFGRHLLSVLQAEWITPDVSHPYEVWRDSIRQRFDSA